MLGSTFEQAVVYATIIHGDQTRKQPDTAVGPRVPYMAHLLGVASLVLEDRGGEEEAVAALLHDAVEDRGGMARLTDIRLRFGERVADIVEGCSDAAPEAGKKKAEWLPRKQAYVRQLHHLDPRIERAVLRVSMADKLYNLRATVRDARNAEDRDAFWSIFETKAAGQVWYYQELTTLYGEACPDSILLSELEGLVKELGTLVSDEDRALAAEYARMYARAA